mmetsp:Transcript_19725/g.53635  ORF Transcript_19725/g.53635 Transcript_19725/m.53635 type:complete len:396 (-) Transcript_19725:27-1214(-)
MVTGGARSELRSLERQLLDHALVLGGPHEGVGQGAPQPDAPGPLVQHGHRVGELADGLQSPPHADRLFEVDVRASLLRRAHASGPGALAGGHRQLGVLHAPQWGHVDDNGRRHRTGLPGQESRKVPVVVHAPRGLEARRVVQAAVDGVPEHGGDERRLAAGLSHLTRKREEAVLPAALHPQALQLRGITADVAGHDRGLRDHRAEGRQDGAVHVPREVVHAETVVQEPHKVVRLDHLRVELLPSLSLANGPRVLDGNVIVPRLGRPQRVVRVGVEESNAELVTHGVARQQLLHVALKVGHSRLRVRHDGGHKDAERTSRLRPSHVEVLHEALLLMGEALHEQIGVLAGGDGSQGRLLVILHSQGRSAAEERSGKLGDEAGTAHGWRLRNAVFGTR